MQVELGKPYKDRITGFKGNATARCEYLTGPPRVELRTLGKDGNVLTEWFDESALMWAAGPEE